MLHPANEIVNASEMTEFFPYIIPTLHAYVKNSKEHLSYLYFGYYPSSETLEKVSYQQMINSIYDVITKHGKFLNDKGFYVPTGEMIINSDSHFIPFCSQETFENYYCSKAS